jgi:3-oxoacyl-(acyl-carrier-protein) synthase
MRRSIVAIVVPLAIVAARTESQPRQTIDLDHAAISNSFGFGGHNDCLLVREIERR